ncbi:hypothetical protein GJAV_G00271800 [Gymnothorax javanicus]|nr:hypothetical protein GJAV_G00271800 [Gymnothorax javanicus]
MDHKGQELSDLGSAPLDLRISAQTSARVTAPVLSHVNAGSINFNIHSDNRGAEQETSLGSTGTGDPHQDENKRFAESIRRAQQRLKTRLSKELKYMNEGLLTLGLQSQFHEIYTELYMTEGGGGGL